MLLDDMKTLLSSGGTTADGTEIHLSYRPDKPDVVLTVYETGGMPPVRAMRSSPGQAVVERPRVQLVMRGAPYDYQTARTKMHAVMLQLDGLGDRTINGCRYLWLAAVQSPYLMGRDEDNRPLVGLNFDVVKELSTA